MNRWLLGVVCLVLGFIGGVAGTTWWTTIRQSANTPSPRATEALRAVASLKSVVSVGLTYPEYLRRLGDVKIKFDEGIDDVLRSSFAAALSLTQAFNSYKLAATIWKIKIDSAYETVIDITPMLKSAPCPQLNALGEKASAPKYYPLRAETYRSAVETAFACANSQLTEAETLLREKK